MPRGNAFTPIDGIHLCRGQVIPIQVNMQVRASDIFNLIFFSLSKKLNFQFDHEIVCAFRSFVHTAWTQIEIEL